MPDPAVTVTDHDVALMDGLNAAGWGVSVFAANPDGSPGDPERPVAAFRLTSAPDDPHAGVVVRAKTFEELAANVAALGQPEETP